MLIGTVVVAIALARTEPDFNLILGPFRAGDYPELAPYLNIPVALWVPSCLPTSLPSCSNGFRGCPWASPWLLPPFLPKGPPFHGCSA